MVMVEYFCIQMNDGPYFARMQYIDNSKSELFYINDKEELEYIAIVLSALNWFIDNNNITDMNLAYRVYRTLYNSDIPELEATMCKENKQILRLVPCLDEKETLLVAYRLDFNGIIKIANALEKIYKNSLLT